MCRFIRVYVNNLTYYTSLDFKIFNSAINFLGTKIDLIGSSGLAFGTFLPLSIRY